MGFPNRRQARYCEARGRSGARSVRAGGGRRPQAGAERVWRAKRAETEDASRDEPRPAESERRWSSNVYGKGRGPGVARRWRVGGGEGGTVAPGKGRVLVVVGPGAAVLRSGYNDDKGPRGGAGGPRRCREGARARGGRRGRDTGCPRPESKDSRRRRHRRWQSKATPLCALPGKPRGGRGRGRTWGEDQWLLVRGTSRGRWSGSKGARSRVTFSDGSSSSVAVGGSAAAGAKPRAPGPLLHGGGGGEGGRATGARPDPARRYGSLK